MQTTSRVRILILVTLLLLLALLTLQACNRANSERSASTGGIFLEGTSPLPTDQPSPLPTTAPTGVPPAPTPEDTNIASVGSILSSGVSVPIYADADAASTVLEVYSPGAAFTVIEPAGTYAAYPVSAAGAEWLRVRASDGMAGWVQTTVFMN